MNDSINVSKLIIADADVNNATTTHNWWLYLVFLLIVISVIVGLLSYFKSDRYKKKKKIMNSEEKVDFNNVMTNAFLSKQLYDELKGKCHPDKFATDPVKSEKATEIMALIVKNKHNYKELCNLREKAREELAINV